MEIDGPRRGRVLLGPRRDQYLGDVFRVQPDVEAADGGSVLAGGPAPAAPNREVGCVDHDLRELEPVPGTVAGGLCRAEIDRLETQRIDACIERRPTAGRGPRGDRLVRRSVVEPRFLFVERCTEMQPFEVNRGPGRRPDRWETGLHPRPRRR